MAIVQIQPDYGLVIFVILASIFMVQWLGFRVGAARKKYEVKVMSCKLQWLVLIPL